MESKLFLSTPYILQKLMKKHVQLARQAMPEPLAYRSPLCTGNKKKVQKLAYKRVTRISAVRCI